MLSALRALSSSRIAIIVSDGVPYRKERCIVLTSRMLAPFAANRARWVGMRVVSDVTINGCQTNDHRSSADGPVIRLDRNPHRFSRVSAQCESKRLLNFIAA